MSELSELSGECQDCGEYNADCVCLHYCRDCDSSLLSCECDAQQCPVCHSTEINESGFCDDCQNSDKSNLSGEKLYQSLELSKNSPFERLSDKDRFVFNTFADVANEVMKGRNK
jgi:hypothetical protein